MSLQLDDGYPLISADDAFRLAWDCKYPANPFPGYYAGGLLPHLPHAKQLVEAGHPDAAALKQYLALGDDQYERVQSQQFHLAEVHSVLDRGVVAGKITAFVRESLQAKFRIISSQEWSTDDRFRGLFREEIRLGCQCTPFPPLLGFAEATLRSWCDVDATPNSPIAAEPRKRGAPVKLDYAFILTTANLMKETGELRRFTSLAALAKEVSTRHNRLKKYTRASRPDTIARYLSRQGFKDIGEKNLDLILDICQLIHVVRP